MRTLGGALLGAALLLVALPAAAQDAAARATARELFEEGVAFVDAEQWEDAADRFTRALALYDSAFIRFNLARAQGELGHLVEAAEHLRNVLHREDAGADVRAAATEQLAGLEPRIARLTIHVEGDADEVRRGGVLVPAAALDVGMPIDPGTHELIALRGGVEVGRATVTLVEGDAQDVVLRTVAIQVEVEPEPELDPEPPLVEPVSDTPLWQEWWLWTIVGVIVIGAAVGIGVGVALSGDESCAGPFMPCRIELP